MGESLPIGNEAHLIQSSKEKRLKKLINKYQIDLKFHPLNPKKSFDLFSNKKIEDILSGYNLIIIENVFSTLLLEVLEYDFPFVIFMDKNLFKINFKKHLYGDIKHLSSSSLLYSSDSELLSFINKYINDFDIWWKDKKTVKTVNKFKNKFIKYNANIVEDFDKIIRKYNYE